MAAPGPQKLVTLAAAGEVNTAATRMVAAIAPIAASRLGANDASLFPDNMYRDVARTQRSLLVTELTIGISLVTWHLTAR